MYFRQAVKVPQQICSLYAFAIAIVGIGKLSKVHALLTFQDQLWLQQKVS